MEQQAAQQSFTVQDLGHLDGPVLLFGGPCSNMQATEAVLGRATDLGIGADAVICTGDSVAYCGAPSETVRLLRNAGITVVAGNCEKQLAAGALTCGCGFEEGSACDLLSTAWFSYAHARIGPDDRDWMRRCPDAVTFRHQGALYAVIHGGVTDIARFIWPTSSGDVFDAEWDALEGRIGATVDHVIAGHCGVPFIRPLSRGRWINAGIIGIPPHDGRQQTRFAVLDGGEVLIHPLRYDVEAACAQMRGAGLTQGYDKTLRTGYWPSEDVLPGDLRMPSLARG